MRRDTQPLLRLRHKDGRREFDFAIGGAAGRLVIALVALLIACVLLAIGHLRIGDVLTIVRWIRLL